MGLREDYIKVLVKKKLFQDKINEHSPLLDSTHREEHEYSVNSILSEGTSKTLWLSWILSQLYACTKFSNNVAFVQLDITTSLAKY